jgi:anaerobic ribonucleoside-triphosphate reductase
MWVAGAGVRQGHLHGETDEYAWKSVDGEVHVHDLHATILHLLGLDHELLTFYHNGLERRLTDVHGEVIRPILAG